MADELYQTHFVVDLLPAADERHVEIQQVHQVLHETTAGAMLPSSSTPMDRRTTRSIVNGQCPSGTGGQDRKLPGIPTIAVPPNILLSQKRRRKTQLVSAGYRATGHVLGLSTGIVAKVNNVR